MPLSPAEKQRRYRERMRAQREHLGNAGAPEGPISVTPEPELVTERMVFFDGRWRPVVRRPGITEEEYVARCMLLPPLRDEPVIRERQERYARWRYAGFVTGEVAAL